MSIERPQGAIDLPNGQWVKLRGPEEVTERHRRPISRAMRGVRPEIVERGRQIAQMDNGPESKPTPEKQALQAQLQYDMTNEEADSYNDAADYAAVALVESWSFDNPITLDGVIDLPGRTLDRLRVVISPLVNDVFLDASPSPNPPAPTGGSNGSATTSADVPQTTSLTSGASTAS